MQSGPRQLWSPDADIILLMDRVVEHCAELDTLDDGNNSPDDEQPDSDIVDIRTTEIAANLDRLEEKLAKISAVTNERLKGKGHCRIEVAALRLRRQPGFNRPRSHCDRWRARAF